MKAGTAKKRRVRDSEDGFFTAEKMQKAMRKLHQEIPLERLKEYFNYNETTKE